MDQEKHLYILWTSGDVDTAVGMAVTYARKSVVRGWWERVTVILWGASERLAAENADVQKAVREAMAAGVKFAACVAYARDLGVVEQLEALGIEVARQGETLTELIQSGAKLITI